jgi:hypothetical protein
MKKKTVSSIMFSCSQPSCCTLAISSHIFCSYTMADQLLWCVQW